MKLDNSQVDDTLANLGSPGPGLGMGRLTHQSPHTCGDLAATGLNPTYQGMSTCGTRNYTETLREPSKERAITGPDVGLFLEMDSWESQWLTGQTLTRRPPNAPYPYPWMYVPPYVGQLGSVGSSVVHQTWKWTAGIFTNWGTFHLASIQTFANLDGLFPPATPRRLPFPPSFSSPTPRGGLLKRSSTLYGAGRDRRSA
jgi:hypothetical protein